MECCAGLEDFLIRGVNHSGTTFPANVPPPQEMNDQEFVKWNKGVDQRPLYLLGGIEPVLVDLVDDFLKVLPWDHSSRVSLSCGVLQKYDEARW